MRPGARASSERALSARPANAAAALPAAIGGHEHHDRRIIDSDYERHRESQPAAVPRT
jgi:hypothetical protein